MSLLYLFKTRWCLLSSQNTQRRSVPKFDNVTPILRKIHVRSCSKKKHVHAPLYQKLWLAEFSKPSLYYFQQTNFNKLLCWKLKTLHAMTFWETRKNVGEWLHIIIGVTWLTKPWRFKPLLVQFSKKREKSVQFFDSAVPVYSQLNNFVSCYVWWVLVNFSVQGLDFSVYDRVSLVILRLACSIHLGQSNTSTTGHSKLRRGSFSICFGHFPPSFLLFSFEKRIPWLCVSKTLSRHCK